MALADLSASFTGEALAAGDAYARALTQGDREAWISFVAVSASLARRGAYVDSLLNLRPREREACEFFGQIARENDDLLVAEAASAA